MRAIVLFFAVIGSAYANEQECLSRIMHAEAQGEPFEGLIAIGQAAIKLSGNQNVDVCQVKGVKRAVVPESMKEYYHALSRQLLETRSTSVSKGADHWSTGKKPEMPGKITRQIHKHVFYKLDGA